MVRPDDFLARARTEEPLRLIVGCPTASLLGSAEGPTLFQNSKSDVSDGGLEIDELDVDSRKWRCSGPGRDMMKSSVSELRSEVPLSTTRYPSLASTARAWE